MELRASQEYPLARFHIESPAVLRQFDMSACLGAIAAISFSHSNNQDRPIPADEIKVALVDILGTISAMVEQSLPSDLKAWADEVAAQFAASFHAARSALSSEDLLSLQLSESLN